MSKKGRILNIDDYRNRPVQSKKIKRMTIVKDDGTFIADMVLGDDNIVIRKGYSVLINEDYIKLE